MARFWRCSPHPTPTSLSLCPEHAGLPQTLTHLHAPGHSRVGAVLNLMFPRLLSQGIAMMNALVLCTCIIVAMNESFLAAGEDEGGVCPVCWVSLCSPQSAVEPPCSAAGVNGGLGISLVHSFRQTAVQGLCVTRVSALN